MTYDNIKSHKKPHGGMGGGGGITLTPPSRFRVKLLFSLLLYIISKKVLVVHEKKGAHRVLPPWIRRWFSSKFCEILKKTFFTEHVAATASQTSVPSSPS